MTDLKKPMTDNSYLSLKQITFALINAIKETGA